MELLKKKLVRASVALFESHIQKHKMNIEIILSNPIAIHDHTDIMGAIELELGAIAEYEDKLEALRKHFPVVE